MLDQGARLGAFVQDLGLAFINTAPTAHWDVPCFVEIHEFGVLRMTRDTTHDGAAVKARNLNHQQETEQEPGLLATYLIRLSNIMTGPPGGSYTGLDQGLIPPI